MVGNKSPSPALTFQGMLANSVRHDPMTNEVGRKKTSAYAKKNDALNLGYRTSSHVYGDALTPVLSVFPAYYFPLKLCEETTSSE